MERTTRVMVGACRCPGTPHPEDWVDLATSPPIAVGVGFLAAIRTARGDEVRLSAMLGRLYVEQGIVDWSFIDDDGTAAMVDPDSIEKFLPWDRGGADVAGVADGLYSEIVLRPLRSRTSRHSQDGQTDGSTSPILQPQPTPRTPSRRSSRKSSGGRRSGAPAR